VYAEASSWLFPTAIWQVPGVFWRIHYVNGEEHINQVCIIMSGTYIFSSCLESHVLSPTRNVNSFPLSASWPRNYMFSFHCIDKFILVMDGYTFKSRICSLGVEKLLFMVFNGWFWRKHLFLNASVVYQLLIASPITGVESLR